MRALLLTAIAIIFMFTLNVCDLSKKYQLEGADWVKACNTDETVFYVDINSKDELSNNHYKVWIKMVFKDPTNVDYSTHSKIEFDCTNKRMRFLEIRDYYRDGSNDTTGTIEGDWTIVNPETTRESLYKYVCETIK